MKGPRLQDQTSLAARLRRTKSMVVINRRSALPFWAWRPFRIVNDNFVPSGADSFETFDEAIRWARWEDKA